MESAQRKIGLYRTDSLTPTAALRLISYISKHAGSAQALKTAAQYFEDSDPLLQALRSYYRSKSPETVQASRRFKISNRLQTRRLDLQSLTHSRRRSYYKKLKIENNAHSANQ